VIGLKMTDGYFAYRTQRSFLHTDSDLKGTGNSSSRKISSRDKKEITTSHLAMHLIHTRLGAPTKLIPDK